MLASLLEWYHWSEPRTDWSHCASTVSHYILYYCTIPSIIDILPGQL